VAAVNANDAVVKFVREGKIITGGVRSDVFIADKVLLLCRT